MAGMRFSSITEQFDAMDAEVRRRLTENSTLGPGAVTGKFFSVPVADGKAFYEITATTATTATIRIGEGTPNRVPLKMAR